ncbi:MAG: hypothetical protein H7230_01660 [Candidatus Parcubacteria bacterium]|nr:hypothetical protein [Candidatus Paceibacterota bacterium]
MVREVYFCMYIDPSIIKLITDNLLNGAATTVGGAIVTSVIGKIKQVFSQDKLDPKLLTPKELQDQISRLILENDELAEDVKTIQNDKNLMS